MGSTRLKNKKIRLTFGATDYWADATSVVLDNEELDSDITTFEDAQLGRRQEFATVTAAQSTATGSLWRYCWDNVGEEGVAFVYAPHGNEIATANEPHFTGSVTIPPKPSIGGEAGTEPTFEVRFDADEAGFTLDDGTP